MNLIIDASVLIKFFVPEVLFSKAEQLLARVKDGKVEASKALIPLATDIAIVYEVTVYDALYLSMAKVYETQMMTADKKLFDLTAKTNLKKSMMWLGSYE